MGCILKRLETSPFCWRWFCRCAIIRLCHAFPWTWNIFTNGALIPTIYLACSFVDAMLCLRNFGETFFCSLSFAHVQSTSVSKSAYFCLSHMRTTSKTGFGKFLEWKKPELLRGFPYFQNALLFWMIFQNKYCTAITVGMYENAE